MLIQPGYIIMDVDRPGHIMVRYDYRTIAYVAIIRLEVRTVFKEE